MISTWKGQPGVSYQSFQRNTLEVTSSWAVAIGCLPLPKASTAVQGCLGSCRENDGTEQADSPKPAFVLQWEGECHQGTTTVQRLVCVTLEDTTGVFKLGL